MTACVNKKHTRRVALAISASLVGALSLGAAAPAFAATGIDLLAENASDIANGTVSYKSGESGANFVYNGFEQGLVPSTLTPYASEEVELELCPELAGREAGYYYYYVEIGTGTVADGRVSYVNADGDKVLLTGSNVMDGSEFTMPDKVGNYAVVVGYWDASGWDYVSVAGTFSIVGQSLADATLFQGDDVDDTTFNYTGEKDNLKVDNWIAQLGVAIDGVKVDSGLYNMAIYEDGKSAPMNETTDWMTPGKDYTVLVTGNSGSAYAGQKKEIDFKLQKLDLSAAAIEGQTVTNNVAPTQGYTFAQAVKSINGVTNFDGTFSNTDETVVEFVKNPSGGKVVDNREKGAYTFRITATEDNPYVTGSREFTVLYADAKATFDFGNADIYDSVDGDMYVYEVDLNEDEPSYFDVSEFVITAGTTKLKSDQYTVTVTDEEGRKATVDDLKTAGTWYVKATVNTKVNGVYYAGTCVAKINNYYTVAKNTDVFFAYDGKNVEAGAPATDSYTGEDLSANFAFKVKAGDKELVEGTDYEVTITTTTTDGKTVEVDEVVDAGTYKIQVKGITYKGADEVFTFIVTAMKPASAKVTSGGVVASDGKTYLTYTGSELTPGFTFYDAKGNALDIPADAYTVWYNDENGDKADLTEKGVYNAHFVTAANATNYDLDGLTVTDINVSDSVVFADVDMSKWYSQWVYDAADLKYMNGYKDTDLFGPEDTFTRAQAVITLFRMAGGTEAYPEYSEGSGISYSTSFNDVDPDSYYAYAVKWAEATGVVEGYQDGSGKFGPEDPVTREQFAQMLANYAAKTGVDVDAAEADLSAYPDAGSIDSWAYEAMEWAVSEGIMGGNTTLNPTDLIQRAEVAKMVVSFQPDGPADSILDVTEQS